MVRRCVDLCIRICKGREGRLARHVRPRKAEETKKFVNAVRICIAKVHFRRLTVVFALKKSVFRPSAPPEPHKAYNHMGVYVCMRFSFIYLIISVYFIIILLYFWFFIFVLIIYFVYLFIFLRGGFGRRLLAKAYRCKQSGAKRRKILRVFICKM